MGVGGDDEKNITVHGVEFFCIQITLIKGVSPVAACLIRCHFGSSVAQSRRAGFGKGVVAAVSMGLRVQMATGSSQ